MAYRLLDLPTARPVRARHAARAARVEPVAGRIGAAVTGVRLCSGLDDETARLLRRALLRHKVLFLRGQGDFGVSEQAELAALFGEPSAPIVRSGCAAPWHRGSWEADDDPAGGWHTDGSDTMRPPGVSVLHALTVPPFGGDTVWANTAAAYDHLPVELREIADRLWIEHAGPDGVLDHPLVTVHPETGERVLLLGAYARRVAGLSDEADAAALIRLFQEHVTALENTVRWRWRPGDVVIWDNRATQHRDVRDVGEGGPGERRLRLVACAGSAPLPLHPHP
ncbi:TauD/TfdA dioxygenase family protein [Actinomadura rupiterrae]|uniref:TauD/TfdA dioxygenase family protein n=1 Tax=Actinomadura rupiterrae TaxID=559627 RepID=UPI0020A3CF49|nr:TauD/TfdA family dioxygenase [Actinomadura rupiterrae]MCP2338773.1 taurine dioxygenase [Actinomadura rupiterrae]